MFATSNGQDSKSPRFQRRSQLGGGRRRNAETEDDFFAALKEAGVLVKARRSVRTPEEITGYAVALPHNINQDGQPV